MKFIYKYTTHLIVAFVILILIQVYAFINTAVSFKYEVDLTGFHINYDDSISDTDKKEALNKVAVRKKELQRDFKIIIYLFITSIVGLFTTITLSTIHWLRLRKRKIE